MRRDVSLKPRESKELPPEKLLEILRDIYPEEVVDEVFERLMEEEDDL